MTRITLDAELRDKLQNLREPVELCDENGRVVGRVFPVVDLDEYELVAPPLDEDEIQRRLSAEPRYTTQEVLEHLEDL